MSTWLFLYLAAHSKPFSSDAAKSMDILTVGSTKDISNKTICMAVDVESTVSLLVVTLAAPY